VVVLFTELHHAFGQRAGEFRPALEHESRGLAASMGIDYANALHAELP
jgi:hypothetical protein